VRIESFIVTSTLTRWRHRADCVPPVTWGHVRSQSKTKQLAVNSMQAGGIPVPKRAPPRLFGQQCSRFCPDLHRLWAGRTIAFRM